MIHVVTLAHHVACQLCLFGQNGGGTPPPPSPSYGSANATMGAAGGAALIGLVVWILGTFFGWTDNDNDQG